MPSQPTVQSISLIQSLIDDSSSLPHRNSEKVDALLRRVKMIFSKVFGQSTPYIQDLNDVHFFPVCVWDGMSHSFYDKAWESGKVKLSNILKTALEELQLAVNENSLQDESRPSKPTKEAPNKTSNQVFVVHGHDEEMKQAVARVLETLGLEPIILHEQPDRGRTVMEKFIDYSAVRFAVVLFSPDDLAYRKSSSPDSARPRARQNVVLELGFFLGKLGRERVIVLHRQVPNFEMPSDYAGVLFKPFDAAHAWRLELVRELNANGFCVDANKLL